MSTNCERPINRYQPPDWHDRNYKLADRARSKREQSLNLRKEAHLLKIETDTKTKWHNFENNMKLSERLVLKQNFFPKQKFVNVCIFQSFGD